MKAALKVLLVLVVVVLAGGGFWWYRQARASSTTSFRTASIERGDITATITATGTVEPEEVIDVGAQVAGQILEFGKDKNGKPIDYGSSVEEGTILAKIDESLYNADVQSTQAQLTAAQAGVKHAIADLGQFKAKLVQARRDWDRAQPLKGQTDALSATQYDAYESAFDQARANVAVGEAAIDQAQAAVVQAQAALDRSNRNLGYCVIKSPVKGVIIDRRVNIGQTVVSSLNAPSLFLIAKDLNRIQVWASVNEADIGNIRPGQPVTFTVDAFPARKFKGTVGKVRLNAQMTQNVVTYTVEITADNSDGKLLPYLTANVSFEVARHESVLMVPNGALRWSPSDPDMIAPDARADAAALSDPGAAGGRNRARPAGAVPGPTTQPDAAGGLDENAPSPKSRGYWRNRSGMTTAPSEGGEAPPQPHVSDRPVRGVLWMPDGTFVRPVRVRLGVTDMVNTEVISDELKEGQPVVIGEAAAGAAGGADDAKNPFAPQFRGGRRRM